MMETAFPVQSVYIEDKETNSRGMTLRDYFAAHVLMTACEDYRPIEAAQLAYAFADAMLEARK